MPTKKTAKAKKQLVTASDGCCFWVHNGPIIRDLRELHEAIRDTMTDEQFTHHVSKEKNDFAQWVADVLEDDTCAKALRRVRTRKSTQKALELCLAEYR